MFRGDAKLVHNREIFMEKHWRSVVARAVCDFFFEAQEKVGYKSSFLFINFISFSGHQPQ